jgi:hypothetical protein
MRTVIKLLPLAITLALSGCSGESEEAKKLGFSNAEEMKQIHLKGWHTKDKYISDTQSNSYVKAASPSSTSGNDEKPLKNEHMVLTPDSHGLTLNACAESYGIMRGYIEIAKINQALRKTLESGGGTLKEIEIATENNANAYVTQGLMSSTLRQTKSKLGVVYLAEASAAAESGRYAKYMSELDSSYSKYQKICKSAYVKTL